MRVGKTGAGVSVGSAVGIDVAVSSVCNTATGVGVAPDAVAAPAIPGAVSGVPMKRRSSSEPPASNAMVNTTTLITPHGMRAASGRSASATDSFAT